MPILAPEPSMFPDNLLESEENVDQDRRWWAVYTKSRQEKSLARHLHGMSVPYYLPLVPKVSLIRGRRVQSMLPLFGSYMFVYGTDEERVKALSTDRIVQILAGPPHEEMVKDLRQVEYLIKSGAPLTVEARLGPGQRVRVKCGALLGVEGVVISRRGQDRLLVAVQFLQQGVSVLIQDFQVEPI